MHDTSRITLHTSHIYLSWQSSVTRHILPAAPWIRTSMEPPGPLWAHHDFKLPPPLLRVRFAPQSKCSQTLPLSNGRRAPKSPPLRKGGVSSQNPPSLECDVWRLAWKTWNRADAGCVWPLQAFRLVSPETAERIKMACPDDITRDRNYCYFDVFLRSCVSLTWHQFGAVNGDPSLYVATSPT